jgi:hypothetical protein
MLLNERQEVVENIFIGFSCIHFLMPFFFGLENKRDMNTAASSLVE